MHPLTSVEEKEFEEAKKCHICDKDLEDSLRVRDHCHLTGKFRGAAHNECNLNLKNHIFIPILFHNLSGYDTHLFIKQLAETQPNAINILPKNKEYYISFSVPINVDTSKKGFNISISLRFLDSFRFMTSGLSKLVSTLESSEFHNLDKNVGVKHSFLVRKGVYPYNMDKYG